jgi:YD repeat-containing protein
VMATNAMYTYINMRTKKDGDKHQFGWKDMFFPWNGLKPNGEDKRLRGVTFPTEVASIAEHIAAEGPIKAVEGTVGNKYVGFLSTTLQAINNTNYLGNKITDADDWTMQSAWDKAGYLLRENLTPMGTEQYLKIGSAPSPEAKIEAGRDAFAAFFGLNEAPAWTGRTQLANQIIQARHNEKGSGGGQSAEQQAKWEKLDAIRDMINQGGTHEQVKEAIKNAMKAGVSAKSIQNLEKNIHISTDKTAFKAMSTEDQVKFLKGMDHEQRKAYWPYAHEKARLLLKTKS